MKRLLPPLLALTRPLRAVRRFQASPEQVQEEVLVQLLRRAASTEWGRHFDFFELARQPNPVEAFRDRVPLQSYKTFSADIHRGFQGERDIFWPGRFKFFATSAGTTTPGKLLPISEETLRYNNDLGLTAILNYCLISGSIDFLGGTPLALTGALRETHEKPGVKIGEISGLQSEFLLQDRGLLGRMRRKRSLPPEIRDLSNWDRKLDAISRFGMGKDVRILFMVPSWGLGLFDRLMEHHEHLTGKRTGTIGEIWPNLRLVICGGVPLSAYRSALHERIGLDRVDFIETYGASEGFMAFQSDLDDPALLLHLDCGLFYEFVPVEEIGTARPTRLSVAEVETGVRYAVYLSTSSGLWAYPVGDVVRFTRLHPHKILVSGRTVEALDSFGEDLTAEEFRAALCRVCDLTGAQALQVHVTPRPASEGRWHTLQVLIEFAKAPESVHQFALELDRSVRSVSSTYDACRREKGMGDLELVVIPPGGFYQWLKQTRSAVGAQTKVPLMSEDRLIANGLLRVLRSGSCKDEKGSAG